MQQKSLKYQVEQAGHGYVHRAHRSKRNRKFKGNQYKLSLDRKRRLEELKLRDNEEMLLL